jgi:hypothetical protein
MFLIISKQNSKNYLFCDVGLGGSYGLDYELDMVKLHKCSFIML